ncbi:MAG TPA: hypothetical protein VFQ44_02770 [Streptosporangiaceae bacterium]|nr:hypothetical protein [Streptosporangiaceae bacterium]
MMASAHETEIKYDLPGRTAIPSVPSLTELPAVRRQGQPAQALRLAERLTIARPGMKAKSAGSG